MESLLANLSLGFSVAFSPENLLFALVGSLVGTLIGVLPGIGPLATVAMLLPITFYFPPAAALIMLASIYYGSQYGGSTTAILLNLPGEASAVVTCLDGHQMAIRGRAGAALAIAALGSLFAGCVATFILAAAAPSLASMAMLFAPAEYFSLMVLGLVAAVVLAQGAIVKAVAMIVAGLLLGLVGTDINSGAHRMMLGIPELSDGINFVPLTIGLFALPEIVRNLERPPSVSVISAPMSTLWPNREEFRAAWPAVLRGTGVGAVLGVLPGGGALLSSFAAYSVEKRIAKDPSRFGRGAVEGLAAPESANNAGVQTSFIPLLTLGLPSNAVMALIAGALIIQGIQPGPNVMVQRPELFWGLIASMWIGNVMLVLINLPMIGIWVRLLKVPYRLLYPSILVFCCIGTYSINNSAFDVLLLIVFGIIGEILRRLDCEPAPLVLAFVLSPLMEENLRRAMLLSFGDPLTFVTRPISLTLLLSALVLLVVVVLPTVRKTRERAFAE